MPPKIVEILAWLAAVGLMAWLVTALAPPNSPSCAGGGALERLLTCTR